MNSNLDIRAMLDMCPIAPSTIDIFIIICTEDPA